MKDFAVFTLASGTGAGCVGTLLVINEVHSVPVPAGSGGLMPLCTASHRGAGGSGIEPVGVDPPGGVVLPVGGMLPMGTALAGA